MNPYLPPLTPEPAEPLSREPVMKVRFGRGYSWFMLLNGAVIVISGIVLLQLSGMAGAILCLSGIMQASMGLLVRQRTYFEVFPEGIEFLSPVFPRWRRAKRHAAIGPDFLHRWIARRDDFQRFVDYRRDGKI